MTDITIYKTLAEMPEGQSDAIFDAQMSARTMGRAFDKAFAPVERDDGHDYYPVTIKLEHADALELERAREALKTGKPEQDIDNAIATANGQLNRTTVRAAGVFLGGSAGLVGGVLGTTQQVADMAHAQNATARDNARDIGIAGLWAAAAIIGVYVLRKADRVVEQFGDNAQTLRALRNERDDRKTGLLNDIDARLKTLQPAR